MFGLWRWTESKAKEKTKARENLTRVDRKGSPSRKARTKANRSTTMTKAVNLEKGSQIRIQGKAKGKASREFAMSATSLVIWPKTAGAM